MCHACTLLGPKNLAVFCVVAPVGTVKHAVSLVMSTRGLTFARVARLSSGLTIARLFCDIAVKGFASSKRLQNVTNLSWSFSKVLKPWMMACLVHFAGMEKYRMSRIYLSFNFWSVLGQGVVASTELQNHSKYSTSSSSLALYSLRLIQRVACTWNNACNASASAGCLLGKRA